MVEWGRDTPWRQGHVLSAEAMEALGLGPADQSDKAFGIVVSHDCDLAQPPDAEPNIELIVGRRLVSPDGNYTHGKNARRLHLSFSAGAAKVHADLPASNKNRIAKESLSAYAPIGAFQLTQNERVILQRWLAARYRRSAFPDEFDRRLSDTGLRDLLGKVLRKYGAFISAVFLDLDSGLDVARSDPNDVYAVGIYLLYDTETDPEAAEKAASDAAAAIRKGFLEKCYSRQNNRWINVELVECEPMADRAMTVHQAEQLRKWSADHMSLKAGPTHSILSQE